MKKSLKISVAFILLAFFSYTVNAQAIKKVKKFNSPSSSSSFKGCNTNLVSKQGEVFSVNPGYLTTKATSDQVTVKVKKTGGRAKTTVNIYANNSLKKRIIFENGSYTTPYKQRVLNNVKNKNIKVEIVNQSVGNTFKYNAVISGKRKNVMKSGKPVSGTLIGQGFKIANIDKSCTGKTKIIVRRTGGIARGTIRVLEVPSNRQLKSITFERNDKKKEIIINSNKPLKVELKNVSVGNLLKYKINAFAIQ